jgi:spore coat protein U-like protein
MGFSSARKPSIAFTALACLVIAASPKAADPSTVTTTFTVSTDVQTACVVSATALNFGAYITTAASNATSTITVQCNNLTTYNIGLDQGTSPGATTTTRAMTGPTGAVPLGYSLCSDSASCAKNWGDVVGTDTVPGTGNGSGQPYTVYGHIPAGEVSRAGAYSDTITVTVTF